MYINVIDTNIVCVRLLSVLRDQSVFSSPPQRPTSKVFNTRSYPLHYFLILIREKEPVFPFSMLSAKQGNYWYHFYNLLWYDAVLDWGLNPGHQPTALRAYEKKSVVLIHDDALIN